MSFTANMTQGTTWTGLLSNTMPTVRKQATDLTRKQRPLLPILKHFNRVVVDDPALVDLDLFIENEDTGLTPISHGFETTTPTATDQPHGLPISDSLYLGSIQVSEPELMKADNSGSINGLMTSRYYKKVVAIEKDFHGDLCQANNIGNTQRIVSLEQLICPATHSGTTGTLTADKWNFQQAVNVVQGVTRVVWTSATAGGTGFENLSVKGDGTAAAFSATTAAQTRFAADTNQNPNGALQLLAHMVFLTSDGSGDSIDALLMSPTPYEDLINAERGKIRYMETPEGVNGMPKVAKYMDKFCIGDSAFNSSGLVGNASATSNGSTVSNQCIYGVNFDTILLKFASNGFFRETEWLPVPMSPLAFYMAWFVAAQFKLVGRPDRNFAYFNYGCPGV